MANFLICLDPQEDRRRRTAAAARSSLAFLPDLVTGEANAAAVSVVWAAGRRAPITRTEQPVFGMVFGSPVPTRDTPRVDASALVEQWVAHDVSSAMASPDGYYAGFAYVPGERLVVAADRLGYFPVYYHQSRDVVLIASSPEPFRLHPAYRAGFDPEGLVGLLLTNGLVDNRTLLRGVRRLPAGALLVWDARRGLSECQGDGLPIGDDYRDLSFADHLRLLHDGFRDAMERHAPPERPYSVLLSGGLDSRTVAGYLHAAGREVTAITLGLPSDLDVRCAKAVARSLRAPQHIEEIPVDRYRDYAEIHVTWEHCASGSSLLMNWGVVPIARAAAAFSVTGLGLDWILGGHAPVVRDLSFRRFFAYQNAWGMPPSRLAALLRPDRFADLVPDTMALLERIYCSFSDVEWQRCWGFSVRHRNRFHIGSEAWRYCFSTWPVLPATDGWLLRLGGHLPPATMADRRAQFELLRQQFPGLAALPLDRNSANVSPASPSPWWQLTAPIHQPMGRALRALLRRLGRVQEQRRYYRIFDFNGAGWVDVRRTLEPLREMGYEFFERAALDALWPPPDIPARAEDGIADLAGLKTILGFLAWARGHL
jgi:asparagine synthase (glutamine-hydrolysing)